MNFIQILNPGSWYMGTAVSLSKTLNPVCTRGAVCWLTSRSDQNFRTNLQAGRPESKRIVMQWIGTRYYIDGWAGLKKQGVTVCLALIE